VCSASVYPEQVASYKFAVHPRWLAGHVLVLVTAATMILLGRWQMTVSESKGFDLQNFGYAFQWWAFSIFGTGLWVRIIRDRGRGIERKVEPPVVREETVAYRRYVMPNRETASDDPELARYNAYLAGLSDDNS